jgi:hypothetical protein
LAEAASIVLTTTDFGEREGGHRAEVPTVGSVRRSFAGFRGM